MGKLSYKVFEDVGPDPEIVEFARCLSDFNVKFNLADGEILEGKEVLAHLGLRTRVGYEIYGALVEMHRMTYDARRN